MADFTVKIPNAKLPNVVEALTQDYEAILLPAGTPNPVTKLQHAKNKVALLIAREVKDYNVKVAMSQVQSSDPGITVE